MGKKVWQCTHCKNKIKLKKTNKKIAKIMIHSFIFKEKNNILKILMIKQIANVIFNN